MWGVLKQFQSWLVQLVKQNIYQKLKVAEQFIVIVHSKIFFIKNCSKIFFIILL